MFHRSKSVTCAAPAEACCRATVASEALAPIAQSWLYAEDDATERMFARERSGLVASEWLYVVEVTPARVLVRETSMRNARTAMVHSSFRCGSATKSAGSPRPGYFRFRPKPARA